MVPHGHRRLLREDGAHQGPRKLGAMDLFPLGHQGEAGQRVVVLPAGQAADTAQVGGNHLEAGPIPLAPDHALVISRGYFATFK